jgi:DNA topoisomerase-1
MKLLALPRTLGNHPESGKPVKAGIGRFGPYVVHEGVFKSFGKDGTFDINGRKSDVLNVDLETAVEMLKQARKRASATPVRELGKHPEDASPVAIFEGRYGPFVRYGDINVTIPKGTGLEEVTLEQVAQWAAEKAARGGPVRGRRGAAARAKKPSNGQKTERAAKTPQGKSAVGNAKTKPADKSAAGAKAASGKAAAPKTSAARKTPAAKKKAGRTPPKLK